jgi:hypothetical protein
VFSAQPGLSHSNKLDQNVEKGTLIVDIINQKTDRLHWRSIGQVIAGLDKVPEQNRKQRLEQFVNFLLSDLR